MRLNQLTPGMMQQAIRAYVAIAWPAGYGGRQPVPDCSCCGDDGVNLTKSDFLDESHAHGSVRIQRFTCRPGNDRYPNMKLVLQEFMVQGQFFFSVDSHDQLPVAPGSPGFESWQQLRDYNAWLKHRIENRWRYPGVPTLGSVVKTIKARDTTTRIMRPRRVMVVDDDDDIASAVVSVLEQKGFIVVRMRDGREALEMIDEVRPDLIVMDYMMPRIDGGELCRRLKSHDKRCRIPVLLATTTPIELIGTHRADGFLVKPFTRGVLLQMVMHLLGGETALVRPRTAPGV